MPSTFAVLIIGDASSPEMQTAVGALSPAFAEAATRCVPDVDAACRLADVEGWQADLCLACQHWSDEFTESDVTRLLGLFPLARFVCAYGPWCASDGRTRDAWPLSVRVPAEAAAARIAREIRVLCGELPPLPLTASRDEIYEFETREM